MKILLNTWEGYMDIEIDQIIFADTEYVDTYNNVIEIDDGVVIAKKGENIHILVALNGEYARNSVIRIRDFIKILKDAGVIE